jgi:hypothetical protein
MKEKKSNKYTGQEWIYLTTVLHPTYILVSYPMGMQVNDKYVVTPIKLYLFFLKMAKILLPRST